MDTTEDGARAAALRHFPNAGAIERYVDILLSRGIAWGLLGPRERERIWARHVVNSVPHAGMLPDGCAVVDVGSGAGLPGIPLALLREDIEVVLLEPLLRRAEFLELTVGELNLGGRVSVIRGRVEELTGRFDVLTCRAVAPLNRLARWCAPALSDGAVLLALKGATVDDEIVAAAKDLRRLGLEAEALRVAYTTDLPEAHVARVWSKAARKD